MKARTLLVAAVMFLGLSAAAFAQANFSTGSTPVTAVVKSGHTEKTGDITFTQTSGSSVVGTITISYGVPITVPFTSVAVTNTGGYTASVNAAASSNSGGTLVINVTPAGVAVVGATITVSGVRVGISGTALTVLDASLSSTGNTITTGQLNPRVISSIADGIASHVIFPAGGYIVNAVSGVTANSRTTTPPPAPDFFPAGTPATGETLRVTENFLNAFGAFPTATETTSTLIRFTLSAAPPAGVSITFEGTPDLENTAGAVVQAGGYSTRNCATGAISGAAVTFTNTTTVLTVCYGITAAANNPSPTLIERVAVDVSTTISATATLPLTPAAISATVTFAPVGTAFTSTGAVITTPIPRYAAVEVGPVTIVTIVGANTTLLIPFATTVTGSGFNTGIAIANSTNDPGTTPMGFATAVRQTGTMTFYFFPALPSTAAPFTYTTVAGSPGSGLNATGALPTGSTYTVLLSQLLSAAGQPADFSGYIFVITNFTNAHCLYVVSNFTSFSQGSLALVVPFARTLTPEGLNN